MLSPLICYSVIPCVTFVPPCIFDHECNTAPYRKSVHKLPPFCVTTRTLPCCDHWLQLSALSRAGSSPGLCRTAWRLCCEPISRISACVCTWFVSIIVTHLNPPPSLPIWVTIIANVIKGSLIHCGLTSCFALSCTAVFLNLCWDRDPVNSFLQKMRALPQQIYS